MKTQGRKIVEEMYAAFDAKDLERVVKTFTDDAVCIYHGTQTMPAAKFKGSEGVRMFFDFNFNALKVVFFNKSQFIEEANTIIVLGNEHFISNQDGSDIKNTWVQIYTIANGLIARMEEFATSALPHQYGGNAGEQ